VALIDSAAVPAVVRAAAIQTAPVLGDVAGNLERCLAWMRAAAADGCRLVVFAECALSGYMFDDATAAWACAEPVPGDGTEALARACAEHGVHCVIGLLERAGERLHNTAVLIGPDGLVGRYRKSHIACVGADCFTVPGAEPFEVYETPIGRIGMQICYDWRFPEITRILALQGAEIIAHPTNSPVASRELAEFMTRARAAENAVFLLTANRCGREARTEFFGWSQIVDPLGRRLAEAQDTEAMVVAELDLTLARSKVKAPGDGVYQVSLFDHRRPELYGPLSQ
jgi:predicted amidohydrolase